MTHYNVAILGNDPAAERLVDRARARFQHVFWTGDETPNGSENAFQFLSEKSVAVETPYGTSCISADALVLATGVVSKRPAWMSDHPALISDASAGQPVSNRGRIAIVGCGREGLRTARRLQSQSRELVCIDGRRLAAEQLSTFATLAGVSVLENRAVIAAHPCEDGITLMLEDTTTVEADAAYVCCGTRGKTADCNLAAAGLRADDAGKLWCNEDLQTWTPGIYALGGVIGYPCQPLTIDEQCERILHSSAEQADVIACA